MNLFTKYSRINVIATIVIFVIASTAFYFTLRFVFVNQIDQDLKIEEKEIETFVKEHNRLPETISVKDQMIHFEPSLGNIQRLVSTKTIMSPGDHKKESFRQLTFGIEASQQWYTVNVSKSLEEAENLTKSILVIASTTILLILLVSFVINRVVLRKIWSPFYQSLSVVKEFKIGTTKPLQLASSNINEFQLMNRTLEKITSQAQLEYLSLKTFSENASHEIQTPLAVIRSKLDLMIQDEHLTEKQGESLQAAYNSVQKLTRLNQSLLLLAKIENNQFHETTVVDLKRKLEEKIADFHELWTARQLSTRSVLDVVSVLMNEELIEVLLNNLLSNATKHNFNGGRIEIELAEGRLAVANTSRTAALDPNLLYQRFTRMSNLNETTGLGLSIIKQICETSGFKIHYEFANEMHVFSVRWKP